MPKSAFYKLSEKKQVTIKNALYQEFTHKQLQEATVKNIVINSNISRGSFYNYFIDLNDAYFFIFQEIKNKIINLFKSHLTLNNGNIFEAILDLFVELIIIMDEHTFNLINNYMILQYTSNIDLITFEYDNSYHGLIDNKFLDKIEVLFQILSTLVLNEIIHTFKYKIEVQEAKHIFSTKLKLLEF